MIVKTLAGKSPVDIGLKVLRGSDRPALPSTRDRTLVISGRNGAWDFGADMEPRHFALDCAFLTRDSTELQAHVETFARLLVDLFGKPKTVELVFEVHPDRTYYVRYSGSLPIARIVGMGRFTLPLIAFDPYALGPEQIHDFQVDDSPESFSVVSGGDIVTEPIIVIRNTGSDTIHGFTIQNTYEVE